METTSEWFQNNLRKNVQASPTVEQNFFNRLPNDIRETQDINTFKFLMKHRNSKIP